MRTLRSILLSLCLGAFTTVAGGEVYRVGPGEQHLTISSICGALRPGDTVEVTGDITGPCVLTMHGTKDHPITIRGRTRVEAGRLIRPKVTGSEKDIWAVTCMGDHTVIEGIEFVGRQGTKDHLYGGIHHSCNDLVVRNCVFRLFNLKAIEGTKSAGDITVEFCEFHSIGDTDRRHTVDVWSFTPGATMTVEHCYFHDGTGGSLLKTHASRNVVRYNWFENCYYAQFAAVDMLAQEVGEEVVRKSPAYPMHTDIVGNVFFQGWSPGSRWSTLRLGGEDEAAAGTEGDFTIAHNLFVQTYTECVKGDEATYLRVAGNVDKVRCFNNAFVNLGDASIALYSRGAVWDAPRTAAFVKKRGSGEPLLEGSNNWMVDTTIGVPPTFTRVLKGPNPKFVDLVRGDFHPRSESPLAGAGLWPLPKGRIVDLVPEYEPQRGIPIDLKPTPRRKAVPPSIGPFEAPAEQQKLR